MDKSNRSIRRARLLALALALPAMALVMTGSPVGAPSRAIAAPPDAGATERRAEAGLRFNAGLELYDKGAWAAALAEFLEARRLFPLRNATNNAAVCLERLGRYDEALDLFDALLLEFGEAMPASEKERVERKVTALRGLVGTIEIEGAEPGAAIIIDGRERSAFPALAPLRVGAGSHVVRVAKAGFFPFETRVEVAGGQLARVNAPLRALTKSGRLHVSEHGGRALFVLVDGSMVGKTPWDGQLGVGEHVVSLRGEGDLGAPPVLVSIVVDRTTQITLFAEELAGRLRISPVPVNAMVAIDAVTMGHGVWEGRLRVGAHRVEVAAPGFLPYAREVWIARGERTALTIPLQRDPTSLFGRNAARQPRFIVELFEAVTLAPTFGGEIAGGCTEACRLRVGAGGYGVVRGGYELGAGLGLGIMAGYLTVMQAMSNRGTTLQPIGLALADKGIAEDTLKLRGVLVGAFMGWSLWNPFPVHVRFGAGALLGSIEDARNFDFTAQDGKRFQVGAVVEAHAARLFALTPEVRVGLPLSRHVEVTLGLSMPILISPSPLRWGPPSSEGKPHLINAGSDGSGTFAAEVLLGRAIVLFAPGVGARYAF